MFYVVNMRSYYTFIYVGLLLLSVNVTQYRQTQYPGKRPIYDGPYCMVS